MHNFCRLLFATILAIFSFTAQANQCSNVSPNLLILGSGGAKQAGGSFLVRDGNKARVLVNVGGGSALRFAESGAAISDLKAILFTNVQADSTAGLPALVQLSVNKHRETPLPVFGPGGHKNVPSTVTLVRALFEVTRGAYRHLGSVLTPLGKNKFKLQPRNVEIKFKKEIPLLEKNKTQMQMFSENKTRITTTPVTRDNIPALAWRIKIKNKTIVFAGKTSAKTDHLSILSKQADALVVPVPRSKNNSISLANIARLANQAGIKKLVLTHRTDQLTATKKSITKQITQFYKGAIFLPNDLDCINL